MFPVSEIPRVIAISFATKTNLSEGLLRPVGALDCRCYPIALFVERVAGHDITLRARDFTFILIFDADVAAHAPVAHPGDFALVVGATESRRGAIPELEVVRLVDELTGGALVSFESPLFLSIVGIDPTGVCC